MKRTIMSFAVAALALGGAIAIAAPALAADTSGLDAAKTAVTNRINLRLTALQRDTTIVAAAKDMTADHRTTLTVLINQDTTGLTALKSKVAGETTLEGVKADAQSMVDDYRVFILVGPKVRLTRAGDVEAVATTRLRTVHDKLADLVAKAKAAGKDTTTAEQDLADMSAALDKVGTDTSGQVAAVLAIPAGPDAAGIHAKVSAVQAALAAGRADLKRAVDDAKKVREFLKSATHG
jgi:hypothetical protein